MSKNKGCHSKPKSDIHTAFSRLVMFKVLRIVLVMFLDDVRKENIELDVSMARKEQSSEAFVDSWIGKIKETLKWKG
jgi:hypothetical protein